MSRRIVASIHHRFVHVPSNFRYTFPQQRRSRLFTFFTRLFTARSACIHLTGRNQPYKLVSSLWKPCPVSRTLSTFLLSLFPYLSIILFPRTNLLSSIITYTVFKVEDRPARKLRWREVSEIIGSGKILYCKWSIWDIAVVGVKTIFSIFAFTFINPL